MSKMPNLLLIWNYSKCPTPSLSHSNLSSKLKQQNTEGLQINIFNKVIGSERDLISKIMRKF